MVGTLTRRPEAPRRAAPAARAVGPLAVPGEKKPPPPQRRRAAPQWAHGLEPRAGLAGAGAPAGALRAGGAAKPSPPA